MKNNVIQKAAETAEKLILKNKEAKALTRHLLDEATEKLAQLEEQIKVAAVEMDAERHHKLSDEYRRTNDNIEMYRAKLESLDSDPLMPQDECQKLIDEIIAYRNNRIKNLRKRAGERIKELREMYNKENEMFSDATAVLGDLRKAIMRDDRVLIETDTTGTMQNLLAVIRLGAAQQLEKD